MVCPRCGSQNVAQARLCSVCGVTLLPIAPPSADPDIEPRTGQTQNLGALPPLPAEPYTKQFYEHQPDIQEPWNPLMYSNKPGNIQAIAVMCLIDGILNLIWGVTLISTFCLAPLGLYAFALGILEIVYSTKLFATPITAREPNKILAWMQIGNIFTGDFISLTVGVLSLMFYNDVNVQHYFREAAARQPIQPVK